MTELTPAKLAEIIELGEVEAQADFCRSAPSEYIRLTRMQNKRYGSVLVAMIPLLDTPFFNRILALGIDSPASETLLDEAIAMFHKAGCLNYMAQVSPLAEPSQLPEWLASRGLKPSRSWAKMYRGDEPAPVIPTSLRLQEIGKDQADAFADVILAAFGMPAILHPLMKGIVGKPGWHNYMAFDGDTPAAAASMFVNGEVVWLGNMGTLKKYRKRGAQGALQSMRIEAGRTLGCKWFVTETGEDSPEDPNPSYHNMLRTGFKLAYLRRNYVHQSPARLGKVARRVIMVAGVTFRMKLQHLRQR